LARSVGAHKIPRAFVVQANPAEPVRVRPDGVIDLAQRELRLAADLRDAVVRRLVREP
jgi:hypothetical protein